MKSLIFSILLACAQAYSQWQPDVRLTNNSAISSTSGNNAWCIAASGPPMADVHVVWSDNRDGNYEIYYKRSTDGGLSWGTDTRLTNAPAESYSSSVSVSDLVVHVVWQDNRNGTPGEIYYKRSTDGGVSWGTDTRLTNETVGSWYPSATVSGSAVYVVWQQESLGHWEIYFNRSSNGGESWGTNTQLTNDSTVSWYPSVSASDSVVHVLWEDTRDGNGEGEIYYKRSINEGVNWGAETRLTYDASYSNTPSVSVSGSVVHVVWHDDRDGDTEIYYKRSTDGGVSWEIDKRLTNNNAFSKFPSVSVSGSVIHVVWFDERDEVNNWEIYYKHSTDGGISWGADTRLTNNSADSQFPSVSVSDSVVHVVWYDYRDGNYEIYYKNNPTGNITGIETIFSELPYEYRLEQNYPNPFNPTTSIEYRVGSKEYVTLKVYDLLGREVATLVNEEKPAGSYEIEFDASNLSSGIYFYQLQTQDFAETKKMMVLK
jgi:hypothetical protein